MIGSQQQTYMLAYPRASVSNKLELQWHVDGMSAPHTFVVTLGGSTEFLTGGVGNIHYGMTPPDVDIQRIVLHSGDAVLFAGGVLQHAVGRIYKNAPSWFTSSVKPGVTRTALLLR